MSKSFESLDDAYNFLEELGASSKLLLHVKLVGEAAEILIEKLGKLSVIFDKDFVRLGVVFHDSGKIIYPVELAEQGSKHESEGKKLLLKYGIEEKLANVCESHGKWETYECSFEEYLIALSDKLWKGKRETKLENLIIDIVAQKLNKDRWDIFVELDSCFEFIASQGDSRLIRSQTN